MTVSIIDPQNHALSAASIIVYYRNNALLYSLHYRIGLLLVYMQVTFMIHMYRPRPTRRDTYRPVSVTEYREIDARVA